MLNTFEKKKEDKYRLANIILLEVPNHHHKHNHSKRESENDIE